MECSEKLAFHLAKSVRFVAVATFVYALTNLAGVFLR